MPISWLITCAGWVSARNAGRHLSGTLTGTVICLVAILKPAVLMSRSIQLIRRSPGFHDGRHADAGAAYSATLHRDAAETSTTVICLDTQAAEIAAESRDNPATTVTPDNLAYIIYTLVRQGS